jgi:hypothetical protein
MTQPTRNEVSLALFELLKTADGFQTSSRRFQTFDQIAQAAKPALYVIDYKEEHMKRDLVTPAVRILYFDVYIFIFTGDPKKTPIDLLNTLIERIDPVSNGVLKPDNAVTNRQTLGNLCYNVYIDGEIVKVPGDLDGQGVAIIPVKVVLP